MSDSHNHSQRSQLNAFIHKHQPELGKYSLRRAVCRQYDLKRFDEISDEQAGAVLQWLTGEVERLKPLWQTARLAEKTTAKIIEERGIVDSGQLQWWLMHKVMTILNPLMSEEEALQAARDFTAGKNLYELAHS